MTHDSSRTTDRLDTLSGVFFFGLMAYLLWQSHFGMALICIACAAAFPFIVVSTRRAKVALFGSPSIRDEEV